MPVDNESPAVRAQLANEIQACRDTLIAMTQRLPVLIFAAAMAAFCAPKGHVPSACPQGHPREATDDLASPAGDAAEGSTEA